ncbi:helix-turn-helix transcriptional regulator [Streptomyces sp. NPDC006173]|uniref:helix-turn-helix domain-containing protein n=1 Tax=Streptomyces sp. NPDC006173 TaxID=3155349 RepID=UPI0033C91501
MATGRIEMGPTGQATAANLRRIREARGLSLRALSVEVRALGRPLSADAINKIENGRPGDAEGDEQPPVRRVDADDLVALALALNVSPLTLLLPDSWGDEDVWLTEQRRVQSRTAWLWGQGLAPAVDADPEGDDQAAYKAGEDFRALALPAERRRAADHSANREAQELTEMVARLVQATGTSVDGDSGSVRRTLRAARLRLRKLEAELEQIEITADELDELSRPPS